MVKLSEEFLKRLRLNNIRMYKIAQMAGIHHTTLSRIINGIERIKKNDPRVIRVGHVLGLKPNECFEEEQ